MNESKYTAVSESTNEGATSPAPPAQVCVKCGHPESTKRAKGSCARWACCCSCEFPAPPTNDLSKFLIIEPHTDGSVYIVNPDPLLRDPVNGMDAVIAKCSSIEEARQEARRLVAIAQSHIPAPPAHADLVEALAALAHEMWSGWMRYLFAQTLTVGDDCEEIQGIDVRRWQRQIGTPYADLPENEKESDRIEARKMIAIFSKCKFPAPLEVGVVPADENMLATMACHIKAHSVCPNAANCKCPCHTRAPVCNTTPGQGQPNQDTESVK